jgi:PAS domain S-box-containing protein
VTKPKTKEAIEAPNLITIVKKSLRNMSREDLMAEVERLRSQQQDTRTLELLLHELRVHQEEIKVQNAELIDTRRALEESRDRYVDLYDFAPIGYMTLDAAGVLLEINLTGALLLSFDRSRIQGMPFAGFVTREDQNRFFNHLMACREEKEPAMAELVLRTPDGERVVQLVTKRRVTEAASRISAVSRRSERRPRTPGHGSHGRRRSRASAAEPRMNSWPRSATSCVRRWHLSWRR